ncbi:MAG: hypothetical protein IJT34_03950 [Butyrivibrio sp.]|nr:hypothetical protein [Butyrivibrio sp.]
MNIQDALERVLRSYEGYYNVSSEGPVPFAASAVFHLHDEQYFLTKKAKISTSDSHEYVYFATIAVLDEDTLAHLVEEAWNLGLSQVTPAWNQKGSDISLFILTEAMEDSVARLIRRTRRSRNYFGMLKGWSNFRLIAYDTVSGNRAYNRLGESLAEVVDNIFGKREEGKL